MVNVTQWLALGMTLNQVKRPLNKGQSFILVAIDFLYATSYRLSIVFCSRTHRLATIHNVIDDDDDDGRLR